MPKWLTGENVVNVGLVLIILISLGILLHNNKKMKFAWLAFLLLPI